MENALHKDCAPVERIWALQVRFVKLQWLLGLRTA